LVSLEAKVQDLLDQPVRLALKDLLVLPVQPAHKVLKVLKG
jgi:hypothetical protein